MSIVSLCSNNIMMIAKQASLLEAAQLMKQSNIGAVLVVDNKDTYPIPYGILTDRDIMLSLLETNNNLSEIKVEQVVKNELFTLPFDTGIKKAIEMMAERKVRRLPIVDADDKLIGIVSTDDLLILLAGEMHDLANLVRGQLHMAID